MPLNFPIINWPITKWFGRALLKSGKRPIAIEYVFIDFIIRKRPKARRAPSFRSTLILFPAKK